MPRLSFGFTSCGSSDIAAVSEVGDHVNIRDRFELENWLQEGLPNTTVDFVSSRR